jgi:hypothetical protein
MQSAPHRRRLASTAHLCLGGNAWVGLILFIGASAFVVGMAIHSEAIAQHPAPRPEPIYYCATGLELPAFEPCKERKDQRDI